MKSRIRAEKRREKATSKNATIQEQLDAVKAFGEVQCEASGFFLIEAENAVFGDNRALHEAGEGETGKTYVGILSPENNISVYGQANFNKVVASLVALKGEIAITKLEDVRKDMTELIKGETKGRVFFNAQTVSKLDRDFELVVGVSSKAYAKKDNTTQAGLSLNIGGGNVTRYEKAGMVLKQGLELLSIQAEEDVKTLDEDVQGEINGYEVSSEVHEYKRPELNPEKVKKEVKAPDAPAFG